MGTGNLQRTMRDTSLDLTCLNQEGPKSYVGIPNLAALFDRSVLIGVLITVKFLPTLLFFLCPEVHHLAFWLFPNWHLSSGHLLLPALNHETAASLAQLSLGFIPVLLPGKETSWLHVSPHCTPIVRSFTFQFLHKWNFAVKFTSLQRFPFHKKVIYCVGSFIYLFILIHANWIHICVIFSSLLIVMCCLLKVSVRAILLLAWLFLPVS